MNDTNEVSADGEIATGLVDRVRGLLLAMDRRDRFEDSDAFAGWLQEQTPERMTTIAREVFLRALRRAGDSTNYRILEQLDGQEPVSTAALMRDTALDRVALVERLNDLAQVGLLSQDTIDDQVRRTPLADGVLTLVERTAVTAGGRVHEELSS